MARSAVLPRRVAHGHDVRMDRAQAATIVSALAAFTGLQALWISRALDRVSAALDRIEARLD